MAGIGKEYLLYVARFHFVPGDDTGVYVLTGDQALYKRAGGLYEYAGTPVVHDAIKQVPQAIDAATIN
jgi:hypothetical protein